MEQTKKKLYYGWPLVVVLGFCYFLSSGFVVAAAQMMNPVMMGEIGINATMLGLGFTVFVLASAIPAPLVGGLLSKLGSRLTIAIGGIIMIVGSLGMIFLTSNAVTYILFFGIFMGVGQITAGQISAQSTAGMWFSRLRGSAMSIMMGIGGVASFVAPLIVTPIIGANGWRAGWWLLAGFGLVIVILALLFVRTRPEDMGLEIDGGAADHNETQAAVKETKPSKVFKNTEKVTYGQLIKTPAFWIIAIAGCGGFCGYGLTTGQGVLNFTTIGFDPLFVAGAASVMGILSFLTKTFTGFIADRIDPKYLLTGAMLVQVIGIFIGAFADPNAGWMVYAYYVCIGLGFGTVATNLPTLVANYLGVYDLPKNLSTIMLIGGIISSIIPAVAGVAFDMTGTCQAGFILCAVFEIICIICGILVRAPKVKGVAAAE